MDGVPGLFDSVVAMGWPGGSWQSTVAVVLSALITYLLVLWALMVWWTFRDIRERTRDPFLQAAAVFVVLVFSLPGLLMYLVGRPKQTLSDGYARTLEEEALLQELEDVKACPACRRRVQDEFIICPICQTQLKEPCSRCSRPLSYAWAACPYCATPRRLPTSERAAAVRRDDHTDQPTVAARRPRPRSQPSPAFATLTDAEQERA